MFYYEFVHDERKGEVVSGLFIGGLFILLIGMVFCASSGAAAAPEAKAVRIAHLVIKPECLEAFNQAVKEEMRDALAREPGVIALYAVADRTDPARMTFFEMYVDDEAYEEHRKTPHFIKYFETTKDMIAERVLVQAVPVELRDKHNTPPE